MRTRHLHRKHQGLVLPDGVGLQIGYVAALPTATVEWEGRFLRDGDGIWACQSDGGGGYEWVAVGSPLTTKGDLYGFDTGGARIPVGANGTVLTADSSDAQGVSWQTLDMGYVSGPYVIFHLRPHNVINAGDAEWTNMGSALAELWGASHNRRLVDLSTQTEYHFHAYVHAVSSAAAFLQLYYTTDLTGATGWTTMGGTNLTIDATGWITSGWDAVPALAKDVVLLRVMGDDGNSTADPQFLVIAAQFRGEGVQGPAGADGADGSGSLVDLLMLGGM
jgi:hypothetical protein